MARVKALLRYDVLEGQPPIKHDHDEARKSARLAARIMLNQGDGTFVETNKIADDLAAIIVRNLRSQGLLKEEESK